MSHRRLRRVLVAAAAAGLVGTTPGVGAAAGPAVGQVPDPATATFPQVEFADQGVRSPAMTDAVQMTKDELSPTRAFTGPTSMLASPDDPRVIVAATADLRTKVCHLARSVDAGATWSILDALPGPQDYPSCTSSNAGVAQASIAWGSDGVLYYGLLGYGEGEGGRAGNVSVVLARSTDLGDSWKTAIVDNNRGKTGEEAPSASGVTTLTVDTSGDRDVVYVGFSRRYSDAPKGSPLTNSPVMVGISTDGGESFDPPVNLNEFVDLEQDILGKSYPLLMSTSFGRPFMTAHDGVVLAVSDSRTPTGEGPDTDSYNAMPYLIARSTDQGKTWSVTKLSPPVFTGAGAQTGLGWTPEGGEQGTFVVAYAATPETAATSGIADIVMQRSTDQGQTWSEPLAIDDDEPGDNSTSFYPQMGIAPNGRIDVVWQDNRALSDFRFDVRYTYSTDGGLTWAENVQVNDQPVNFNLGVSLNSDVRQPPGVASANEYAAIGWADSRLGDSATQTQDSFSAVAQFEPLPAQGTLLPILAAGFGGLVLAGVVMLIVLLRRRPGSPPPSSVEERETVRTG